MVSNRELSFFDFPHEILNPQDKQLISIVCITGKTPLEVIGLLVLKIIDFVYACVTEIDVPSLSELFSGAPTFL
jgi:hypothetical protein